MNIKELRMNANLTQVALAKLLDVSQPTVAGWETGTAFPRVESLPKLAAILHCTIDDLFREDSA